LKHGGKSIYQETNCQLKRITSQLNKLLEQNGYKALSIPKSRIEDKNYTSLHTLIADLGEREGSNTLQTTEVSRVNWGTVLTNAPLKSI